MASLKNLESALLTLQANALKHYGAIEMLINNPVGVSGHTDYVDEIIKHAKALSECEEAYGTLQNHFVPKAPQAPAAAPPSPISHADAPSGPSSSTVITEDNSSTMRRAKSTKRPTKKKGSNKND
jgi:hypothetical protein